MSELQIVMKLTGAIQSKYDKSIKKISSIARPTIIGNI